MIGYHYTTYEAYQKIKEDGLQLSLLEERHKHECREVLEFIKEGCIWVYSEFMQDYELIGQILYVAVRHENHHLVCLKVDYPEWESASKLALAAECDVEAVNLDHELVGVGPFGHNKKRFDLITAPVSPKRIHLVGEWNLLDLIQMRVRVVAYD